MPLRDPEIAFDFLQTYIKLKKQLSIYRLYACLSINLFLILDFCFQLVHRLIQSNHNVRRILVRLKTAPLWRNVQEGLPPGIGRIYSYSKEKRPWKHLPKNLYILGKYPFIFMIVVRGDVKNCSFGWWTPQSRTSLIKDEHLLISKNNDQLKSWNLFQYSCH